MPSAPADEDAGAQTSCGYTTVACVSPESASDYPLLPICPDAYNTQYDAMIAAQAQANQFGQRILFTWDSTNGAVIADYAPDQNGWDRRSRTHRNGQFNSTQSSNPTGQQLYPIFPFNTRVTLTNRGTTPIAIMLDGAAIPGSPLAPGASTTLTLNAPRPDGSRDTYLFTPIVIRNLNLRSLPAR